MCKRQHLCRYKKFQNGVNKTNATEGNVTNEVIQICCSPKQMNTCLSYLIVIIIFIIIYMNDNESLKSIIFIAETCAIHTE